MTESRDLARVMLQKKSMGLVLLLTILFGPLGLLYVTILWGLLFTLVTVVVSVLTGGLAGPIFWIISIIWGALAVKSHNEKLVSQL